MGSSKRSVCWDCVHLSLVRYTQDDFPNSYWHAHRNPHLTLLLAGGTVEQRRGKASTHGAGDIVHYPAGEAHCNLSTTIGSANLNFEFEPDFWKTYDLEEKALETATLFPQRTTFLLLKAFRELLNGDGPASQSLPLFLLQALHPPVPGKTHDRPIPDWVHRVREVLQDRWNETVSLHPLARIAGVHPVTISKFFPVYFSCSLGEYVRNLRVEKALTLMGSTRLTLLEIAHGCGFSDQSHFIRIFKSRTGFLPKGLRMLYDR